MYTADQFRARSVFCRFKNALEGLEQEMNTLEPELPWPVKFELKVMSQQCRRFFEVANREVFSVAVEKVKT